MLLLPLLMPLRLPCPLSAFLFVPYWCVRPPTSRRLTDAHLPPPAWPYELLPVLLLPPPPPPAAHVLAPGVVVVVVLLLRPLQSRGQVAAEL